VRLRTVAWVNTTCRTEAGTLFGHQELYARTVVFDWSCDPLGTNPAGNQLFAMRPDGSGLRQITHARGVVVDTPDVVEVELPGPFAYQ
jgi:hypothetical protein